MVKWVLTGACIQLYIARKTRKTASNCRHPMCVLCEHPGLHVRPFGFKLYIKKTLRHRKKIQFPYQCCNWYDGAKCILYDWSFSHVDYKITSWKYAWFSVSSSVALYLVNTFYFVFYIRVCSWIYRNMESNLATLPGTNWQVLTGA